MPQTAVPRGSSAFLGFLGECAPEKCLGSIQSGGGDGNGDREKRLRRLIAVGRMTTHRRCYDCAHDQSRGTAPREGVAART
jgi:hypothetical protein